MYELNSNESSTLTMCWCVAQRCGRTTTRTFNRQLSHDGEDQRVNAARLWLESQRGVGGIKTPPRGSLKIRNRNTHRLDTMRPNAAGAAVLAAPRSEERRRCCRPWKGEKGGG